MGSGRFRRGVLAMFLVSAVASAGAEEGLMEIDTSETALEAEYFFETSADTRVIRYRVTNPLVAHLGSFSLELFGDGRVTIIRPAFMRSPGHYERVLSSDEVSALLEQLLATGITRPSEDALEAPDGELVHIADGDTVEVEVSLIERAQGGLPLPRVVAEESVAPQAVSALTGGKASLARADALLRDMALRLSEPGQ